jgi:predicted transcriptional regulator
MAEEYKIDIIAINRNIYRSISEEKHMDGLIEKHMDGLMNKLFDFLSELTNSSNLGNLDKNKCKSIEENINELNSAILKCIKNLLQETNERIRFCEILKSFIKHPYNNSSSCILFIEGTEGDLLREMYPIQQLIDKYNDEYKVRKVFLDGYKVNVDKRYSTLSEYSNNLDDRIDVWVKVIKSNLDEAKYKRIICIVDKAYSEDLRKKLESENYNVDMIKCYL